MRDPYYEKITWKNVSSNPETNSNPTITARKSLLATIKKFSGVSNCFDHLFSWYLTKKQRKVNYDYTVDFNKDPFINQIFTGEINNKSYFYQKKQQCITASKHIQKVPIICSGPSFHKRFDFKTHFLIQVNRSFISSLHI